MLCQVGDSLTIILVVVNSNHEDTDGQSELNGYMTGGFRDLLGVDGDDSMNVD